MDFVVTERGVYRRDPEGLVFLGEPDRDRERSPRPVCYADEDDFGSELGITASGERQAVADRHERDVDALVAVQLAG